MTASDLADSSLGPFAVRLADWGVLRARGVDAAAFLHSQLTQDIAGLAPGEARLAGWCSPKGRLLATFIVWQAGPDELLMACAADLLAPTLKRLSMFVLRSRCRLSDATSDLALWGLAAPMPDIPPDVHGAAWPGSPWRVGGGADAKGSLVRLPDAAGCRRALWCAPSDAVPGWPPGESAAWDWLEVQAGVPRIVAATADAFVPQMVNFELVGGVDFRKGCFPGQEVVARSQYRGTVKRRMYLADSPAAALPGADVYAAADPQQPAGRVVLAATLPGGAAPHAVLVEAKREFAEGGTLHLGTADGPALQRRALPYDLPPEAA